MTRSIKAEVLCLLLVAGSSFARGQQLGAANAGTGTAVDEQRRSLFAQRASLKRQMGDSNFHAFLGSTFYGAVRSFSYLPAGYACPALPAETREVLIADAASRAAIEPDLLRAVMHRESAFHPCAVSSKGALGLMQLMPANIAQFHVSDPFDPAQSVRAGAALLRTLLDRYQDLKLALAAYNAGASRIDSADPENYPAETKSYVTDILTELGANIQGGTGPNIRTASNSTDARSLVRSSEAPVP